MAPAVLRSAICVILIVLSDRAFAQAISLPSGLSGPQARTRDELDAFGIIFEAPNSREGAAAAESFLQNYPDSEFVEYASLAGMRSYYDLGNLYRSMELAQLALKANPESAAALLQSARLLIAPAFDNPRNLAEARRLVDLGLTRLKRMKLPASGDSRAWLRSRNSFMAVGMSVLGWLSFREGKLNQAMDSLRQAAAFDPQGEYFYRLSLVTAAAAAAATGDFSGSRMWASRAVQAGPEWIATLARQQLERGEANLNVAH